MGASAVVFGAFVDIFIWKKDPYSDLARDEFDLTITFAIFLVGSKFKSRRACALCTSVQVDADVGAAEIDVKGIRALV